jgi:P3 major capsid protein.
MANNSPNSMSPEQANMLARNYLLSTSQPFVRKLGTYTMTPGSEQIITLDRMGIFTRLVAEVTCTMDITAAATASQFGPAALLQQVQYKDFNNVNRVNMYGSQLFIANSIRSRRIYESANSIGDSANNGLVDTQVMLPTATGTSQTARMVYDIPLARNPGSDLTGAVLAQTTVSQHQLILTTPSSLVGANAMLFPYSAGTFANVSYSVTVYEYYLQPPSLQVLPHLDLSTIYTLDGTYVDSSDLVSGAQKYVSYPNSRAVSRFVVNYLNGGVGTANGTDLSSIEVLANSNVQMQYWGPLRLRGAMRNMLGADLPAATYLLDTSSNPISTQLYGNVQARLTFAGTVAAGSSLVYYNESTYPQGTPLPGVAAGY